MVQLCTGDCFTFSMWLPCPRGLGIQNNAEHCFICESEVGNLFQQGRENSWASEK